MTTNQEQITNSAGNAQARGMAALLQISTGVVREVEPQRLPARFGEFVQVVAATRGRLDHLRLDH